MSLLLLILILLAVLAIGDGEWGYRRPGWGYIGFSALGLIVLLFAVLLVRRSL